MPFNGSGTFTRLFNWTADAGNNLPISATKFDGEDNDFASGFGNCLTRDGQGAPTTPLTWTQPLTINLNADGTVIAAGRTAGVNNPQLQIKAADATGIALALNGTNVISIANTRAVSIGAPTAGPTLALTTTAAIANALTWTDGTRNAALQAAASGVFVGSTSADILNLMANGASRIAVASAGNVTINTPSSGGTTLALSTAAGGQPLSATDGTVTLAATFASTELNFGTASAHLLALITNGAARQTINSSGAVAINTPASGNVAFTANGVAASYTAVIQASTSAGQSQGLQLNAGTGSGDTALSINNAALSGNLFIVLGNGEAAVVESPTANLQSASFHDIGYVDEPQNLQNANYTLLFTDRGKQLFHTSGAAHTYTIPSNASVGFPVGTIIRIINEVGGAALTIAINTDTLVWAPSGTTGSRTLTSLGTATIEKMTSTRWVITGVNLS